jgi:lipoate-protein ligase A
MTFPSILVEKAPQAGAWNMAVDEFLFRTLPDSPKTVVRFYQWERPTASLGYGQDVAKVIDLDFCRANGVDIVRRITGGKLVLHHREVTYSVCSSDAETFTETLAGSYKLISQGLMKGLERMGLRPVLADKAPPFYARGTMPCFSHPAQDEVELGGLKIIGSAQKRVATRFLQHGSIPLAADEGLLKSVSFRKADPAKIRMTSLSEALGRPIDFSWAVEHFVSGLAEHFETPFVPLEFSSEDLAQIDVLAREKYASESWTLRGESRA